MSGKMELTFIGMLILAAMLSLGLMSDPIADVDLVQSETYTASGLAWNN